MFNKNLKRIRLRSGLTQKDVADFLHISPQSISKWENGDAMPSIDFLPPLSMLFKCSIDELFEQCPSNARSKARDVEAFFAFLSYFEEDKSTVEDGTPFDFMAKNCDWQDNCKDFFETLVQEKFISLHSLESMAECDAEEVAKLASCLEKNNVLIKVPDSKLYAVNQEPLECTTPMIRASWAFQALGQGKSVEEAIAAIP